MKMASLSPGHSVIPSFLFGRRFRVLLSVAVGVSIIGFLAKYLRRQRSSKRKSVNQNGHMTATRNTVISPANSSQPGAPSCRPPRYSSQSQASTSSNTTITNRTASRRIAHPAQDALIYLGSESIAEAIRHWEKALSVEEYKADMELMKNLDKILESARNLSEEINQFLARFCPEGPDGFSLAGVKASASFFTAPGGCEQHSIISGIGPSSLRKTMSILSDDSFVSAMEDLVITFEEEDIFLREPLKLRPDELEFYQQGLALAQSGQVAVRTLRTEAAGCSDDEEFLAKLYCIRAAYSRILLDHQRRGEFIERGRQLLGDLLRKAGKDPTAGFFGAYDGLLNYLENEEAWPLNEEELKGRSVPYFTFYDVVLDFILMDSFDDLAHPPASALAVAQNRFLSDGFKETTISTLVWSILKAKRARLQRSDGFIARFYDISEHISPTMAWGFLGTNEKLREFCYYFKDQICNYVVDIFSFDRVRYTTVEELAEDVWQFTLKRADLVEQRLHAADDEMDTSF